MIKKIPPYLETDYHHYLNAQTDRPTGVNRARVHYDLKD